MAGKSAGATALDVGDMFATGQVLRHSVGTEKDLARGQRCLPQQRNNAGIGCGIKNVGIGNGAEDGVVAP